MWDRPYPLPRGQGNTASALSHGMWDRPYPLPRGRGNTASALSHGMWAGRCPDLGRPNRPFQLCVENDGRMAEDGRTP